MNLLKHFWPTLPILIVCAFIQTCHGDAEASPDPAADADPDPEADPLWDKFPQLQKRSKFTRFGATQKPTPKPEFRLKGFFSSGRKVSVSPWAVRTTPSPFVRNQGAILSDIFTYTTTPSPRPKIHTVKKSVSKPSGFWGSIVETPSENSKQEKLGNRNRLSPLQQTAAKLMLFNKKYAPNDASGFRYHVSTKDNTNLIKRIGQHTDHQMAQQSELNSRMEGGGIDLGLLKANPDLNTRLLASTKAVNVLTKVRDLQDEIHVLNRQIAEENLKFNAKKKANKKAANTAKAKQGVTPLATQLPPGIPPAKKKLIEMLSKSKNSAVSQKLGAALKLLVQKQQQRLKPTRPKEGTRVQVQTFAVPSRSPLSTASPVEEFPIKDRPTNFQQERELLIQKLRKTVKAKQQKKTPTKAQKLREIFKLRNQERKQQLAQEAHKRLAANSNQRVIDKIQKMKLERQRAQQLKRQKAADKKLSELRALKILQQKKLENLRRKNNPGNPQSTNAQLLQLNLEAKLPPSSPILRLSNTERQNLLSWLDLQRNSEILSKTDKKIAEKLKNQKLTQEAAKQTLAAFDFDDFDAVDNLSDTEIDDILLSIIGDEDDLDFEYYDYEDYDEEELYDDELLDILGPDYADYEYEDVPLIPVPPPRPPPIRPVKRPRPPLRPVKPRPRPPLRPPKHHPKPLPRPAIHHPLPKPTPPFKPPPNYEYEDEYYDDYYDYPHPLPPKRPGVPGPVFLDEVEGILNSKHPHGKFPKTLLSSVHDRVKSELSKGPPDTPGSFINVGKVLPPQPPFFESKKRPLNPGFFALSASNISKKKSKPRKPSNSQPDSLSFSELMADFLKKKPSRSSSKPVTKKPLTSFRTHVG